MTDRTRAQKDLQILRYHNRTRQQNIRKLESDLRSALDREIDLLVERDQLAAQVGAVREALKASIDEHEALKDAGYGVGARDSWLAALSLPPPQALAELRAQEWERMAAYHEARVPIMRARIEAAKASGWWERASGTRRRKLKRKVRYHAQTAFNLRAEAARIRKGE